MSTEFEQGTCASTTRRRHSGYFAGDFTNRPLPTPEQLQLLVRMRVPAAAGMSW